MGKHSNLTPIQMAEKEVWRKALTASNGSLRKAALELGVSRTTALKRVRLYGLKPMTENNVKYRRA